MNPIMNFITGDAGTVMLTVISIILMVLGIIAAKVLMLMAKKLGIDVDDKTMTTIMSLINKFVIAMNQDTVDNMKKLNADGKLTPEQQIEVFNKVYEQVESSLTDEERQYLINKFNSLEKGLKALIESSVGSNHK
jgi:hypothetical protein